MIDYSDSVTPSCPLRSNYLPGYTSPWLPISLVTSLPAYPNNPPSTFS